MREAPVVHRLMLMHRPATIRHRTSLFEDATAIVEAEYAADLSLDDIARRVASSRRQLQRAYAEIGGGHVPAPPPGGAPPPRRGGGPRPPPPRRARVGPPPGGSPARGAPRWGGPPPGAPPP